MFFSLLDSYDEIASDTYSKKKVMAWEQALREEEKMYALGAISPKWVDVHWTDTRNYPLDEKCLFYVNASWMYNIWLKIDSAKTQNMMPAELPVLRQSTGCYGGYMMVWGVLKNSPNREQAIKLMLAINKNDVAEKWGRYTKSPTGIKSKLNASNFGMDKFEVYQNTIDKKYGRNKVPVYNNAAFCIGNQNIDVGCYDYEVMTGVFSANEAIKKIESGLKKKGLL